MPHRSTCFLLSVGMGVVLSRPSTAWAQGGGTNLVIAMSHSGNFTVGENGVYNIVVSNVGATATGGSGFSEITVTDELVPFLPLPPTGFTYVSMTSPGLNCFENLHQPPSESDTATCTGPGIVIPPGGSIPITLTVRPHLSGTVANTATVTYQSSLPNPPANYSSSVSDPTIVVAAVPTLPQWAVMALTVLWSWRVWRHCAGGRRSRMARTLRLRRGEPESRAPDSG
jgi:hypothetical protein